VRRLAAFIFHNRGIVLLVTLVLLPITGLLTVAAIDKLSVGGFSDPAAESNQARLALEDLDAGNPEIVIVATAASGSVDDDDVVEAGTTLTDDLSREHGVAEATSYWTLGQVEPLRSTDSKHALVLVRLDADDDEERQEIAGALAERYNVDGEVLSARVGGEAEVKRQATEQAEKDLQRAEMISIPLTLVALVAVFGGVVAALVPVLLGLGAILMTLAILFVIASLTDVSVFALNLTTALGLGLAIDYSLFIISRLREERAAGHDDRVALSRTLQTAGRTIAFSASTVAVSLAALFLFPAPYLRSFAFAGVIVVTMAALTSLVVLPAVLAVLGPRIDALPVFRHRGTERADASETGFWHSQALRVMAHPWPIAIVISGILVVFAIPFLRIESGMVDDRVLPASLTSRQALDVIREEFESRESSALVAVAEGVDAAEAEDAIDAYARDLAALPGVARVDAATGYYLADSVAPPDDLSAGRFALDGGTWLSIVPSAEPLSAEGEALAHAVRDLDPDLDVEVGGPSAELVDAKQTLEDRLPLALGLIALTTFVLLFMMTGSLLVPVKALVLNMLSLTATFGAIVWIFQDGRFAGFLDFTPTGSIDTFTPLLMFCVAFGLSMDYEVFVLSRIKEEYDLTGDNTHAVAVGLQKTGRIVTAAAALLAIVFIGIATSSVTVVKMLGVGLTLAVLVDAFLIRATLVPALMQLAGRANWWAPRFLRRFHLRYGIFESEPISLLDLEDDEPVAAKPGDGAQPPGRDEMAPADRS
jgi:RND superfamily putative drug exporter